ncbi:2804_t:CDS:2 [Gigaspora margarita]|uniref:2804_t:CDS:1 n=1 Tax=Gigaspora margarita TaxID=4874 RepID=A0ABN7VYA5_GIGMA|nr:2804_t:CDS:2 [Gigaspora margarita]
MLQKLLMYVHIKRFHLLGNYTSEPNAIIYEQQSPWIFMNVGNTIFSNIVESDDNDGNGDSDKRKDRKPDKLGYPLGIVPILEELPKWKSNKIILIMAENRRECSQLCEYLSTMNKGLEEVRGRNKDSVQSKSGPESSSKKVTLSNMKDIVIKHIHERSVAVAANHCLDS